MGDLDSVPGLERSPGGGKDYPLQYSGLENSMDFSPWGRKQLETTEQLSFTHLEVRLVFFCLRLQTWLATAQVCSILDPGLESLLLSTPVALNPGCTFK